MEGHGGIVQRESLRQAEGFRSARTPFANRRLAGCMARSASLAAGDARAGGHEGRRVVWQRWQMPVGGA